MADSAHADTSGPSASDGDDEISVVFDRRDTHEATVPSSPAPSTDSTVSGRVTRARAAARKAATKGRKRKAPTGGAATGNDGDDQAADQANADGATEETPPEGLVEDFVPLPVVPFTQGVLTTGAALKTQTQKFLLKTYATTMEALRALSPEGYQAAQRFYPRPPVLIAPLSKEQAVTALVELSLDAEHNLGKGKKLL